MQMIVDGLSGARTHGRFLYSPVKVEVMESFSLGIKSLFSFSFSFTVVAITL